LIREGRGDGAAYPNLQYQKALVEAGGSVHYLRKTLATAVAATVLVANAYAQSAKPIRGTDSYISTENEPAPKLIADRPVPEALARGPFISTTE
jgi:hypothetical protein